MKIGTEVTISCAHYIPNHPKCGKSHGHNFRIMVEVQGEVHESTGMIADFGYIKKIITKYDHNNLNNYLDLPTCENLAMEICKRIKEYCRNQGPVKVRVYETENNWAEVEM